MHRSNSAAICMSQSPRRTWAISWTEDHTHAIFAPGRSPFRHDDPWPDDAHVTKIDESMLSRQDERAPQTIAAGDSLPGFESTAVVERTCSTLDAFQAQDSDKYDAQVDANTNDPDAHQNAQRIQRKAAESRKPGAGSASETSNELSFV